MKSISLALLVAATVGSAHPSLAPARSVPPAAASAMSLRQDMRKLWIDHVVWTRDYIIAAVSDQADQQAAAARLMKNQEDIGAAIAGSYGKPAGDKLTALLKDHISIAVDLIKAAKAGDAGAKAAADKKWHENAEDIAEFLSKANPNWPKSVLLDMMNTHLSTTTNEVVARLTKNWDEDVRAFDAVYDHILKLSDAVSDGIVKQFPQKVAEKNGSHGGAGGWAGCA